MQHKFDSNSFKIRSRIGQKSIADVVNNEKSEIVDFLHPSLAKSLFLESEQSQNGASMTPRDGFIAIESGDKEAMPFRERLETFLKLEPSRGGR